ncbi:recombinase family protein [Clostridium algidicarnis]|uniref:recombinase family protein n=1 Tax=Clostridium algidicarnis TaxID=37659 RepID=UPI00162641AE|nr:recombinase family protein [Clostridium algidicarnis]MBB6698655.1 recombinase family protein [Clostridium algidicarnis]
MKTRIKGLTAKGNALGYKNLKKKLKEYVTEWVNYFKLADIKGILTNTDLWLRRRIWIVTLLLKMDDKPKLRVAAYCRVSTDSDEQATSYEAQIEHYTNFIQKNEEWEFAKIFADDGISGTNTKKREEFNRMIEECMDGDIDMIITKSISRFARNTLDCLKYIRLLKEKNIPVYFEKENINSLDCKGEILLTIMASLAQQESESLSKNVKLGLQFRYQNEEVQVNHNCFMGYTKNDEGHLIIEPTEAVIVRRIYLEYLQGASLKQIGESLESDDILTAAGKARWRPETIKKILRNEKYIGDALLQKTYTVDILTKKRVKNNGIVPQYYVENSHEPIIPRDLYMQVQEEMLRRTNLHSGENRKKRVYSSKYALSSIVYCPKCGDIYRRIAWNNRGNHSIVWRCCTRVEHGPERYDAPTVGETELQEAVVKAINRALGGKDDMLVALEQNITSVLALEDEGSMESINAKLEELQKELLKRANAKEDYNDLADEIDRLREVKQNVMAENAEREGLKQRIAEMQEFLAEQMEQIEEYDESLVRRMVEKVTVYEEKFSVEFKSGTSVDVER